MADIIKLGGKDFELRKNSRRKNVAAGIDPCGKYFIACPSSFTAHKLEALLAKDIDRLVGVIEKKFSKIPQAHEYNEGEKFLFRGIEYDLVWTDEKNAPYLELRNGVFLIMKDRKGLEYHTFEMWYKRSLYNELRQILPIWTKLLQVNPLKVNIKTVKSIWGSCSEKGGLTFCTRLALVPPELLEYVVVHELCHMIHMNHSQQFWAEVEKHIPDYKEKRNLIKKKGQIYKWW